MNPAETLDEGVIEIRGGGAIHDRDETFRLSRTQSGGYLIETRIVPLDQRYDCTTWFSYDEAWRPTCARAEGRNGDDTFTVEIAPQADHADITLRRPGKSDEVRSVAYSLEMLIDLEPSALPMWAMTHRYDRAAGGVQTFGWIGRSLIRDLVLEGGRTPLECHGVEALGERFTFSETYPLPNGAVFTVKFELLCDSSGLLTSFGIDTGASRLRGTRR